MPRCAADNIRIVGGIPPSPRMLNPHSHSYPMIWLGAGASSATLSGSEFSCQICALGDSLIASLKRTVTDCDSKGPVLRY